MQSNDDIPEDEMLLAKMIQNAKARDLGAHRESYYKTASGLNSFVWTDGAVACCASGACFLEEDTRKAVQDFEGLVQGNDNTKDEWTFAAFAPGEVIGYAFQQALAEDE